MQNIAYHGAGRRGDNADHRRQEGQGLFAVRVEQTFGGEFLSSLVQKRHQRADARGLQRLDHDLIGGFSRKGRDPAGRDHFETFRGASAKARQCAFPYDGVESRGLVLQAKIAMSGRMRAAIVGNLAAHAHMPEAIFDRALQRIGEFGDAELRRIGRRRRRIVDCAVRTIGHPRRYGRFHRPLRGSISAKEKARGVRAFFRLVR